MSEGTQASEPVRDRPAIPDGYGIPETMEGALPWSHVSERMRTALNYWIGTTDPQGRPHSTPVWGVWVEDAFYFDGSPETRRVKNLMANPAVVVHLESGSDVVIIQGEAYEYKQGPGRELGKKLADAYAAKYKSMGYAPEPDSWDGGSLFKVTARKVMAWTNFPADTTRWRFKE